MTNIKNAQDLNVKELEKLLNKELDETDIKSFFSDLSEGGVVWFEGMYFVNKDTILEDTLDYFQVSVIGRGPIGVILSGAESLSFDANRNRIHKFFDSLMEPEKIENLLDSHMEDFVSYTSFIVELLKYRDLDEVDACVRAFNESMINDYGYKSVYSYYNEDPVEIKLFKNSDDVYMSFEDY